MRKSAEQLELEKFWKDVFIAAAQSGRTTTAAAVADQALESYKFRFPPVITPIKDNSPD